MTDRGGRRKSRERGAILLVLLAALTITGILSAVAVQQWTDILRRDNEAEMMFRAQEINRALLKYRRDRGQLPVKLDQLIEPGSRGQYFLRHLYKDPLVRGGKWGLLYLGPGGGIFDPSAPPVDPGAASGLGGAASGLGKLGQLGQPASSKAAAPQGDIVGSFSLNAGGEVTGLPIAGVKTLCTDEPFRIYKDHEEYAEWLFTIFDLEPQQQGQPGQPGQPGQIRPGAAGSQGQKPPAAGGKP